MSASQNTKHIFIIEITYTADIVSIEPFIEAHRSFLDQHYKTQTFLASGPKVPRDGGIILAQSSNRAEIERIVEEDPFNTQGLAHYKIVEFMPNKNTIT